MVNPFMPPRGGRGSQGENKTPVPSAFWQPPEKVAESDFYPYQHGAFFLGWSGSLPVGIKDDRHIVMVAGARGGKTSTILKPNLQLYGGGAIVLDPKGELATLTAKHRAEKLGQSVYVLDPWGVADVPENLCAKFNPLAELMNAPRDDLTDDAALMAEALIQDGGQGSDHWPLAARDFVRASILFMVMTQQNPALDLLPEFLADCMAVTADTDPDDNPFASMADFADADDLSRAVGDVIRNAGRGMMGTNPKERASIMSTARNQLGFLESRPMRRSLEKSSFKLAELKEGKPDSSKFSLQGGDLRKPVTIYLCLPAARMGTHAKWLRLFLNMTIAAVERSRAQPPLPVLLMLEEFAALGHLRALEQAAAYMAGFALRMVVVVQDLTQLQRHYKEGWQSFLGNSGALVAFANTDQTTLDYISKRMGDTFVYMKESQQLGQNAQDGGGAAIRENFQKVPLLAPDEVARLFGRRHMRALVIPADGPPVALDRRHLSPSDIEAIRHG